MRQFFKILENLVYGVAFSMILFLWTFEPKECIQYAGLIVGIGVAFTIGKMNSDEINKLKDEIDKLKKNNNESNI